MAASEIQSITAQGLADMVKQASVAESHDRHETQLQALECVSDCGEMSCTQDCLAPPAGTVEVVRTELTASGTVDDYDDAKKLKIAEAFAAEVDGVDADDVGVTVVAASVKIIVDVPVPASAKASDIAAALAPKFATAEAASTFLADANVAVVSVDAPPTVTLIVASPPPPVLQDLPTLPAAGLAIGILVVIIVVPVICCVVSISVLIFCLVRSSKKKKAADQGGGAVGAASTDSGVAMPQKGEGAAPNPPGGGAPPKAESQDAVRV